MGSIRFYPQLPMTHWGGPARAAMKKALGPALGPWVPTLRCEPSNRNQ